MASRTISNPWAAFSDILFMLFVTSLMGSVVITSWAVKAENRLRGCGASSQLMAQFSTCIGVAPAASETACKVSIGDDKLRFGSGSAVLAGESRAFASTVASCLADSLVAARDDAEIWPRIDVVSIDGYTDCEGSDIANVELGAARGAALYSLLRTELSEVSRGLDAQAREAVLQRLAVRSFGPNRPDEKSPCRIANGGRRQSMDADRRVDISVQSRLESQ